MSRSCSLPLGLIGLVLSNTAAAMTGGPDAFGYTFVDSASPGGPVYSWLPASTPFGTISNCDDCSEAFSMPIPFTFYGTSYPAGTSVQVSANGFLQFPSGAMLMPWYTDLAPHYTGGNDIYWSVYGSAPNRQLVVSWVNLLHYGYSANGRVTFEMILKEGTNEVVYQYADASFEGTPFDAGQNTQIGIQGTSSLFIPTGTLTNAQAIRFSVGVTAVANGPYSGTEPNAAVTLSSAGSVPGYLATIVSYNWDCTNDGTYDVTTTSTTAVCTYPDSGSYTVRLRVNNSLGASATTTTTVTIANVAPTITSFTVPASSNEGASINVSSAATDPAGVLDPLTYTWAWGDGSPNTAGANASHTFADNGTYTVTLSVTDGDGGLVTRSQSVTVGNVAPAITGLTVPAASVPGVSVAMSATATDPAGAADPLTFTWVWGDGSPNGSGASPSHTYGTTGTYTVQLTVTDGDGGSTTQSSSITIGNLAPVITSVVVPAAGNEGASLSVFSSASDLDPLTYVWAWGDTTTTTGANVSHTYADNGTYTVTLTVTDPGGLFATATRTVTVANVAPAIGTFTVPPTSLEGSSVSVDSAATDPGADTLTYTWSWGDGSPNGSGAAETHTYTNQGTYSVGLLVTDEDGGFAFRTGTITVGNVAPTLTSMTVPLTGTEGTSISASGSGTDVGSGALTYTWAWGDATTSTGATATHAYADEGTYTVTLTVADGAGATASGTRTITIANASPTISSMTVPATGSEGASVAVSGVALDPGASDTLTYAWQWGDATPDGAGASASHTYANQGTFTVRLTVTDGDGGTVTQTRAITVANEAPTVASITVPATGVEGAAVAVSAVGADAGAADTLSYAWSWGDSATSTGATASHTYVADGTYTVTLTITDDSGAVVTATRTIAIANGAPVITAMTVPATGSEGAAVAVSGAATDPGSDPLTYAWSWGDGTADGSGADASHTFANEGTYTVTLTVTDDGGGSVVDTRSITVGNAAPTITSVTVPAGDEGVELAATAIVVDAGSADVLTYTWSWGDSTADSVGAVGKHTYGDDGTFTVTLTVTDDAGASVTSSKTVDIANVAPAATVDGDAVGDEGQELAFAALATDVAADTVTCLWDYGDGTTEESAADVLHTFADDGPYTVTLTVADEDGGSSTATWDVVIDNLDPLVALAAPATADEGSSVALLADATDAGVDDVLTVTWDFGDGNTGTGSSVAHAWDQDGTYTVTATVDDGDGGQVIDTATITVANVAPVIDAVDAPATGAEGDALVFTATIIDPSADVLDIAWDFGDGTTGTGATVTHAYADDGDYVVTVAVDDGDGGVDTSAGDTVTVANADPSIVSTAPLAAAEGLLYTYAPVAVDPGTADTVTWALSGEVPTGMTIDATTGELSWTPTYDETTVGTYALVLTATDDDGGSGSQAFTVAASPTDADADGMADTWEGANGLDPSDPSDAPLDPDADGSTNLDEYQQGTDPNVFGGPSQPVAYSPVLGAVVDLQPTLVITNATDPEGDAIVYEFEVYADAGMIDLVAGAEGVVANDSGKTAWDVDVELVENSHGWWRARGESGAQPGPWSVVAEFHVDSLQEPPSDPVAWAPIDDAIVTDVRPTLQWTPSVDPDEDALWYALEVHDASGGLVTEVSEVAPGDGTEPEAWTVDVDLPLNAAYTWTVWAIDEDGLESGASEGTFFVLDGVAPLDVAFVSPADESQIDELSPLIELTEATHGDPASLVYTIELDTALTFDSTELVEGEVDGTGAGTVSWDLATAGVALAEDTWWYARARAVDPIGLSSDWALVHFLVRGENGAPSVPELSSPDDGAEDKAPVLVVADSTDPEGDPLSYVFRVSTDPEGDDVVATSDPVAAGGGPEGASGRTSWAFTGDEKGTLYWSAQAIDDRGAASDFAAPRSFVRGGGCGCSTGTSGAATPLLGLLIGLVLGRRRRS